MKSTRKRILLCLMCLSLLIAPFAQAKSAGQSAGSAPEAEQSAIDNWAADSPALQSIVEFVTSSVDENSDGFIPKADRVAVFDMDGTLYGERFPTYFNDWLFIQRALYDESYDAPEELREFARAWEDKVLNGVPIEDFDAKERELGPKLYEGLTPDEYAEIVRRFKELPVWGFEGMTYGEAYFRPMVSLVKYLYENDYSIYIVSATYRDAVRVMTEGVLDEYIPSDRVIGTDLLYVASGDEDAESMFYELEKDDELVIGGSLFIKNQKTNKATAIQREIGKKPVLTFGNSTGDFSMATYTLQNVKYGGRAYMLLCDDTERDYGDPEAAAAFKEQCDANGFYTVSMKDEFASLYPEGAHKPGSEPELAADAARVSFLGPEGTYTEQAALAWFGEDGVLTPRDTVYDVIRDVQTHSADFAVIPQENSLGGAVADYVDALIAAEDTYVVGEIELPISQTLMGVPGATLSDVKTVCSHAQGLVQSEQWRSEYLPDAAAEEMASTAAAASYVAAAGDKSVAAVAAPGAAELYGLEVLAENVQISDSNQTRFYVLSDSIPEEEELTRAVFVATCEGRQLGSVLAALDGAGLELVTLHDRPEGSRLGVYNYVIEAEDPAGVTTEDADAVCALEGVRLAGRFNTLDASIERIPGWCADSPAMASIVEFVEAVTDESSPDYIPPEERIVLFDSDGTLIGERYPTYSDQCMLIYRLLHDDTAGEGVAEDVEFAKALEAAILNHEPLPKSPRSTAQMAAEAFAGFTVEEYRAYVREFLKTPVPGFEGMTYGDRFYEPMAELVRYLSEHGFRVFICSGTERNFLRELVADRLGEWIPPYQVIGSTFSLTATGQGDTEGRSYDYTSEDQVLLGGNLDFKNLKMNKVVSIVDEIGMAPVLVFGNSSGDFAMGEYALQHGGRAYMLLCDDTERDYGDAEVAEAFRAECEAWGFYTVSMKNEFETIYSDGISVEAEVEDADAAA
ncbi:MAG: haloacid dehalogenase-like hydrolase [Oscillospiraceae bacterium]|nr:haloacid dehalogenase-like hydrolase [Oscillospiraceae bacterium]